MSQFSAKNPDQDSSSVDYIPVVRNDSLETTQDLTCTQASSLFSQDTSAIDFAIKNMVPRKSECLKIDSQSSIQHGSSSLDLSNVMEIVSDLSLSTLAMERMRDDLRLLVGGEEDSKDMDKTSDDVFSSVSTHRQKLIGGKNNQKSVKCSSKSLEMKRKVSFTEAERILRNALSVQGSIPNVAQKAYSRHDGSSSFVSSSSNGNNRRIECKDEPTNSTTTISMSDTTSNLTDSGMPLTKNFVKFDQKASDYSTEPLEKSRLQKMISLIERCAERACEKHPEIDFNVGSNPNKSSSDSSCLTCSSSVSSVGEAVVKSMMKDLRSPAENQPVFDEDDFKIWSEREPNCPQHGCRAVRCSNKKQERNNMISVRNRKEFIPTSVYHKKLKKSMKRRSNAARKLAKKIRRKDKEFFCLW